ncbi:MAG TPA: glycoside hydrolase family 3 protein, partial [Candidatus Dormibacteraeota bacterium]
EMAAIRDTVGLEEGAVRAIAAGADAICVGGGLVDEEVVILLGDALTAAVRDGRLTEERLTEAAGRVAALGGRRVGRGAPERAVGLEAARRALRASGLEPLADAPVVVELRPEASIAVGLVPWGLGDVLAERDAAVRVLRIGGPRDVEAAVAAAESRPLIVVVRDLHRHPAHAAAADAILARRPDAIVVEMGVPVRRPAGAHALLDTHGAARVSAVAAADLLSAGGR